MPASIKISTSFFARDSFIPWNHTTNAWTGTALLGRKKRIDPFVSLWHRSSRRVHVFLKPDQAIPALYAIRHEVTQIPYLVSETVEQDAWIEGTKYAYMLRCHRVDGPSGGPAQFISVRTQGTGQDLGPVVLGTAVNGFADTELRSTHKSEDSEETSIGEYFVTYTRNFAAQEGDFIVVNGMPYRIMEQHADSGYQYARASQESPKFKTASFKVPPTTPAVYDPVTGTMTGSTEVTRQVSVLIGQSQAVGDPTAHQVEETLTLFIYLNHIGFEPWLGQPVVIGSRRYRVLSKSLRIEEKQIKLEVGP